MSWLQIAAKIHFDRKEEKWKKSFIPRWESKAGEEAEGCKPWFWIGAKILNSIIIRAENTSPAIFCIPFAKLSLQLPLAEELYLQLLFVVVVRPSRIVTSPLISLKSKNFKKQSAFIFEFWFRVAPHTQSTGPQAIQLVPKHRFNRYSLLSWAQFTVV